MIILNVEQGSPEWHAARCGVPTASNFDKIVTTKGEPSKQREKYLFQLAAERVTGKAEETYINGAMQRGIEMEAEASALYALICDAEPAQIGLCYKDERRLFAASPDRAIAGDGGLEIKCPQSHTHVGYILEGVLPAEYFQQVQGQLAVTGWKWLDFMSYYPGLKPLIVRVTRDEKFIAALCTELERFCTELDALTERLR